MVVAGEMRKKQSRRSKLENNVPSVVQSKVEKTRSDYDSVPEE